MLSFEQTADAGMFWNAGEVEEVVNTVLPMKAAKGEVVVEPAGADPGFQKGWWMADHIY